MSVLDRSELEQSHIADLHAIAAELGIEGYRRLGRDDLIEAILGGGGDGGDDAAEEPSEEPSEDPPGSPSEGAASRRRGRRLRLRRDREAEEGASDPGPVRDAGEKPEVVIPEGDDGESATPEATEEPARPARQPRQSRQPRGRGRAAEDDDSG